MGSSSPNTPLHVPPKPFHVSGVTLKVAVGIITATLTASGLYWQHHSDITRNRADIERLLDGLRNLRSELDTARKETQELKLRMIIMEEHQRSSPRPPQK